MSQISNSSEKHTVRNLNRMIFILGLVSFFTDISSEMILPIIPLFLVSAFGASYALVGFIDGIGEATANIMKGFSGIISDRVRQKRNLIALGYGLSAISKPIIAFATGPFMVLGARFGDRLGKGIRTSPRDHLLSTASTQQNRGLAFGFHRTMDTAGALIGSLVALIALILFFNVANIYRILFIISFIPATIGVLFVFFIKEKRDLPSIPKQTVKTTTTKFSKYYYGFLVIAVSLYFVQVSIVFLVLKAETVFTKYTPSWWQFNYGTLNGVILTLVSYVIFNIFYASSATYLGKLSDRYGRLYVLIFATILLIIILQLFSQADQFGIPELILLGWILFGFFMASTEGVAKAFVSDLSPAEVRGTSLGIFNFTIGITTLFSAVIFGFLWDTFGSDFVFNLFSILCVIPLIGLILFSKAKYFQNDKNGIRTNV